MKKTTKSETKVDTARSLVDVQNIKGNFLYRKDQYILAFLRISPLNIDLLSKQEKVGIANSLTTGFKENIKNFTWMSLPREVDLDRTKIEYMNLYESETASSGRKKLLRMMISEINKLATSGQNFEHQQFFKTWVSYTGSRDQFRAETELRQRISDVQGYYQRIGVKAELLEEQDIIKLCNLFSNSFAAPYEHLPEDPAYIPMSMMY